MKYSGKPLFLFCWQFIALTAQAQFTSTYNFNFKTYNTLQGLSDNVVLKTVKDKNGFLWIATHNGISRFDGLHFKNYTHNPADSNSLRSIWVTDLLIDKSQTIWASTEWGVCYYDNIRDRFKYINQKNDIQILYKAPLCKGTGDIIWVAAEDGLKKINTSTKKYYSTALTRIADPQFIVHTGNDIFIIGTRGKGLFKYNGITNSFTQISIPEIPETSHYMDAVVDGDKIWIATDAGLLLLNSDGTHDIYSAGEDNLRGKTINELMCVQNFEAAFGTDKLVCGTYDKKLLLFDKLKKAFVYQWHSTGTNSNDVPPALMYNLYSNDKTLWIATDRGLCKLDMNGQQQQSFVLPSLQNSGNNALVRKIIIDKRTNDNLVWLIPWQPHNGIVLYNMAKQQVINEWNTSVNGKGKIYADILQSKNGNIIAVRDSAVDFFSKEKGLIKTIHVKTRLQCIYENENGNLWLGGESGLVYVDVKTGEAELFNTDFSGTDIEKKSFEERFPVGSIKQTTENTLWLASIKYGLFSFNINEKKYSAHRQKFSGSYSTLNRCSAVEITGKDSVWVGTMAGLTCFIPSQNKFINYNVSTGLKSSYIYSVVKDKFNNLWCRGNVDVFTFNTNTKKTISNNMPPGFNFFAYLQKLSACTEGVSAGYEGGFTLFNTDAAFEIKADVPAVCITSCSVTNKNIFFNSDSCNVKPLILSHNQNEISFDFTAVEFNYPDEIEYWHYLQGMENAWVNGNTNRTINYNNLKPGTYRFRLFVKNKRNNTRSKEVSFLFVIKPALWQHWWFWPLIALLFMIAVIFIARKNIAKIKEKEKQKTAVNKMLAELETKMLRSQMNPHFIFNSLNSVQKYIWENKEEDAAEYLASFAKLIRAILENSRKETVSLKEEIEVMKLYIELEHRRSNAHFDYKIKVDERLDQLAVYLPPLIMQPFIENAIWHGLNKKESKGNLLVEVLQKNNQLICIIDDDGIGRQQKTAPALTENKSLGVEITQQRISRLMETTHQYAAVIIEDKKENGLAAGTRVIITLPLQTQ